LHRFQKQIHFLVFSNIFISVCAAVLTAETFIVFNINPVYWFIALIFVCTQVIYSFHYLTKCKSAKTDQRLEWTRKNKKLLAAVTGCGLIIAALIILTHIPVFIFNEKQLSTTKILLAVLIPVLALSYSHRLLPGIKQSIRQLGWLKPVHLSFIWGFTTVILPLIFLLPGSIFNTTVGILLLQRFIFILSLAFLFNINDMEEDKADGLRTFAVVYGAKISLRYGKWLAVLANGSASFLFINYFNLHQPITIICLYIPVLVLYYLYNRFKVSADDAMFTLCYDGMMVLKAALLIFAFTFYN
jgi:4-hydroxybenzoate polyprenyltransferase